MNQLLLTFVRTQSVLYRNSVEVNDRAMGNKDGMANKVIFGEILGSHDGEYENRCLLGYWAL